MGFDTMIPGKRSFSRNEDAVTGLELIILLVAAILIVGYVGYGELSHGKNSGAQQKQGMIGKLPTFSRIPQAFPDFLRSTGR